MIRVFGIGALKTGTTSLSLALSEIGILSLQRPAAVNEAIALVESSKDPYLFASFNTEAVVIPGLISHLPALFDNYPDAVFVNTIRDTESWLDSMMVHVLANRLSGNSRKTWRDINIPQLRKLAVEREVMVKKAFADQPERLLTMNITTGDGWDKLCRFLNEPEPPFPFPHANMRSMHAKQIAYACGLEILETWKPPPKRG